MSNDFWSTLNKKKREELLKSTQTKDSSSVSKTSENLKTGDFWSVLNEDKKRELLSSATTEVAPTRTFMQDDDDIAPVKGGNKNSIFKSGGFSDGVDGVGDFFGDLGQTVLGTTADLGLGILKGAGRLVEGVVDLGTYGVAGVADLFGADKFAEKTKKVAQYSATDEWTKGATDYVDQYSVLGNKTDMVSEGIGQVGAIILTGGAAGAAGLGTAGATALTTGLTGLSGMGSGMNEAYSMGATDGEAVGYGAMVGTVEAVSEMFFAGLGKYSKALGVGGKGLTSIDDVAAKKISNIAAKYITSEAGQKAVGNTLEYAVKSGAEGLEEVISGFGSAAAKDLFLLNDEDEKAYWDIVKDENLLEQFVVGSITSAIAQSGYIPGMTKGSLREANKTGRDFISGLSKNEQTVVDKVYNDAIAKRETDGKKLTNKEKNEIYDSIIEKMDKGYIDIDTIEGVLGGDEYKAYKDNIDTTEKLKAELNELRLMKGGDRNDIQNDRLAELKAMNLDDTTKLTELRKKLDDKLSPMLKNSRLAESYNEKARRSQAFKADLSQYTGKQRAAVERAIKSGVLNNTNRSHELVDILSKIEADKGIAFDYTNNAKLKESGFAVEGKTVNGFVKDGGVTLNVQSAKAWQSTVGHEITHVLEGTEAYGALREALYAYAESKGELESRKTALTELYNGMNADIDAELTADLVGDYLFTDKDFINRLTGNRNLFQKVYDEIKYLCKVATGKELTEIEKVKREFDRAWKERGQIAQSEEYSETDDSGESDINYSISVTDKATRDFLDEQVSRGEYDAETNPDGGYYVTYKSMSFWGYDEDGNAILRSPMAEYVDGELSNAYLIPKDKSKLNWYQATETIDENTGLPSGLLVKAKQEGKKSFSYLPASENQHLINEDWSNLYFNLRKKVQKNGKWVNSDVPARYNPYEHSSNSMLNDQFSAAYLRDNLVTVKMYVPISEDNGAYRAKWSKDPTGWSDWKTGTVAGKIGKQKDLQRRVYLSRYAAPVEIVPDSEVAQAYKGYLEGTDVAIPDNVVSPNLLNELKKAGVPIEESGKVKYSVSHETDANGNELSLAVQKRFANSKVRDENGKLKVMYHGSPETFTVFDKSKAKASGYYGKGFYFTDSDSHAKQYGNTYDVYLNITNPIYDGTNNITKDQLRKFVEAVAENEDYGIDNYGYGATVDSVTNSVYGKSDFAMLMDVNASCVGDMVAAIELFNEVNGTDYNGIITPTETVAFYPEQIKRTDNKKPTDNPDIRYSLSKSPLDNSTDLGYNGNDLYTNTDGFYLDVAEGDRGDFPRKLANKTSDLEKDEIRTVEIIGANKVYYFEAVGYMQGQMLYSANIDDIADYTRRKDSIYANSRNKRLSDRWASVLSSDRGRESGDIHGTENRRAEADVYGVYGESRQSNSAGTQERNGQNFKDDPEEVKSIVAELRKMYGYTENHQTNELAPIKEVSSDDDAFFDGENSKLSLSNEGEQFAPIGNYSTPANETALGQDIAPVGDGVVEDATTTTEAPMPDEIVPMTEEEANALQDEKAKADAKLEGNPKTRKQLHSNIINDIKATFSSGGYDFDDVLSKAKDLSTFSTVDNTPQRVMEKALGYKEGQVLSDLTVNKVAQNETAGIKWLNSFTDRKSGLLAQISKEYNIKPGSKESAAAQMYAEGFYVTENNDIVAYGDAELEADFPNAEVRSNIKGLAKDQRIRQIYDETLEAINKSRTRNAYPEIQKLDNYFLHFRAMEDTFSKLGLPFNPNDIRAKDLPTDLNGVTADLKPGQPFFASAMHRKGKRTSFDLLGGLERYLTSAKNQIYHIDDIQTLRALRNYIADTYGQANGLEGIDALTEEEAQKRIEEVYNSHLSTFAKFLNEEANILAGKTSLIDRGVEGLLGRRFMTFLDTVRKQTGSNMVGYNISSSLTNFLPVAQTLAKSNKFDFLKAFAQTTSNKFGSVFGKGDNFAENSPVMIRRKGADRFYRTPFQKVGDAGYVLMGAVDNISTELIARTKFNELTRKGMSEQQAHIETDKWVSRLMGDRSLGQMPQLYNSKALGFITQFQLEVRNQLDSQFYDTIQETKVSNEEIENNLARNAKTAAKVTSTFVQLAVVQHLFGEAFESVAGYNPAFDIIDVLSTIFGFDDEEDSEDTALDNIEQGFLELLEDLPYTSALTGGRIPISSALPVTEMIKGVDSYGNEKSRLETLLEVAPYYGLPGGYGQIKKTVQGLNMFSDEHPVSGSYTDSGSLRFPVEDTPLNRIQAGIFGQYASKNAREYFDNDYAPLKEKQIQEYMDVDLPIGDYWKYREGLKGLKTQAEKADYVNSLDIADWQKNLLMNNILDRKEDVDMSNYDDYSDWEEFDYAQKNPDKYAFAKSVGGYSAYKTYSDELYDIKADKDEYGKSISGSRKEKVLNYINNLDADYETKIILWKSEYPSDDTYNMDIINYLNNRADLTYEERVAILTELGFTVSGDTVYWD